MNRSARGEGPSPEAEKDIEAAKKEWIRLWNTRAKYSRRAEQLEKQVASAKQTVVDLGTQLKEIEEKFPAAHFGEKKETEDGL